MTVSRMGSTTSGSGHHDARSKSGSDVNGYGAGSPENVSTARLK